MSLASYTHIKAICNQKRLKDAIDIILRAYRQGIQLESDSVAEVVLLCARLGAIVEGRQLHTLVREKAVRINRYLQNNLLNMYLKCGSLAEGQQFFGEMPRRDVVFWNAMISGYAKSGNIIEAIALFWQMRQEDVWPNATTFICVLTACAPPASIEDGAHIHGVVDACTLESDLFVGSTLVGMYIRFGRIFDARCVFDRMAFKDVIAWTSMITGYSECGHRHEALHLFQQMLQEGLAPDDITFLGVLGACASPEAVRCGTCLHLLIVNAGMDLTDLIGSALINMYAKCGYLRLARKVFEQLSVKDMVSWTSLMCGYQQQGQSKGALDIFNDLLTTGVNPGEVTFVIAINACAVLGASDLGNVVYSGLVESGFELNMYVASAVIDMYAKCGSEEDTHGLFHKLLNIDAAVSNAMIDGLAKHGNSEGALQYFERMKQDGVEVDGMTFIGVLDACKHAGLIDAGLHYFNSMQEDYGIKPTWEHTVCMVDILSRAGHLEAANAFVQKISSEWSMLMLSPLLSACRIHVNVDVAESAVGCMIKLQPQQESTYVLLSNVYALSGGKNQALSGSDSLP